MGVRIKTVAFSFNRGILGPNADFRSDLQLYLAGARKCENHLILPQGGITKRRGFQRVAEVPGALGLFEFAFSVGQEYAFVLFDLQIKVYRNDVLVATLTTPWTAAQVPELRWAQNYDTLVVCHKDVKPYRIMRNGSDSAWLVEAITFKNLPYERINVSQTLTTSATTGTVTLTLSGTTAYWTSGHVGCQIKTNGGVVKITAITSGTVATGTVTTTLANTTVDKAWSEEAWSTASGYPRVPLFYQKRLIFAGSKNSPVSYWGSMSGDYFNFDDSKTDDDYCVKGSVGQGKANAILDLVGVRVLQFYTTGNEAIIDGQLKPTAAGTRNQTEYGLSSKIRPVVVDSETLMVARGGKQLRAFVYDYGNDVQKGKNYTTISHDILNDPVSLAYLNNYLNTQANYVFAVNADGTMSCLCVDIEKEVLGWTKITTQGQFKAVSVVGGNLYALVDRGGVRYLEKMSNEEVYLDGFAKGTTETAQTNWSGATWLAGKTVKAVTGETITDALPIDDVTVAGDGSFIIPEPEKAVAIGYGYTSELETLPIAYAINGQLMRGERVRLIKVNVKILNTKDLTVSGYRQELRKLDTFILDKTIPATSTMWRVFLKGISVEPTLIIQSNQPLPQTILGLVVEMGSGMP